MCLWVPQCLTKCKHLGKTHKAFNKQQTQTTEPTSPKLRKGQLCRKTEREQERKRDNRLKEGECDFSDLNTMKAVCEKQCVFISLIASSDRSHNTTSRRQGQTSPSLMDQLHRTVPNCNTSPQQLQSQSNPDNHHRGHATAHFQTLNNTFPLKL